MAFKVSSDAQLVFFNKVFGASHLVTGQVKALLAAGLSFEVSLYNLRAYITGKTLVPVTLTTGSSSLMKQTVTPAVYTQNAKLISDWVGNLFQQYGNGPKAAQSPAYVKLVALGLAPTAVKPNPLVLIKAIRLITNDELAAAKAMAEGILSGVPVTLAIYDSFATATAKGQGLQNIGVQVEVSATVGYTPKTTPPASVAVESQFKKPVNQVIDLKAAQALGQKVHGTSSGSVYHTIAISEHVKVAARIYKSGSISIRAEWDGQPDAVKAELKKLEESGLQMKAGYGSIHFDAQEVPLQRVIGAFLVGTGIQWKAAVMNGADLVIGEK